MGFGIGLVSCPDLEECLQCQEAWILGPLLPAFTRRDVEVRPVLELLSHYRFSSRSSAGRPRDDGWLISIAPGIQVYPRTDLLFEFNVEAPIFQNIDDPIGDRRWAITFAVKFLF